jgi:hypothetical protein
VSTDKQPVQVEFETSSLGVEPHKIGRLRIEINVNSLASHIASRRHEPNLAVRIKVVVNETGGNNQNGASSHERYIHLVLAYCQLPSDRIRGEIGTGTAAHNKTPTRTPISVSVHGATGLHFLRPEATSANPNRITIL